MAENRETIKLQSRGATFGIDPSTEQFVLASANIDEKLGLGAPHVLVGEGIYDILGSDVSHALRNAEMYRAQRPRRRLLGDMTLPNGQFECEAFFCQDKLIVEAVPTLNVPFPTALEVADDVTVLTDALLKDQPGLSAFRKFVTLLRTISGYHCVVLERGSKGARAPVFISGRSELAHCEVPTAAQFHAVEDIGAPTVEVEIPGGMKAEFLAQSGLQWPMADLCISIRAAGVQGCASMIVERNNEVWGVFKFLHARPRVPNKRTRLAMMHMHPLIGQYLTHNIDD